MHGHEMNRVPLEELQKHGKVYVVPTQTVELPADDTKSVRLSCRRYGLPAIEL
jgi:hypothetical protein